MNHILSKAVISEVVRNTVTSSSEVLGQEAQIDANSRGGRVSVVAVQILCSCWQLTWHDRDIHYHLDSSRSLSRITSTSAQL